MRMKLYHRTVSQIQHLSNHYPKSFNFIASTLIIFTTLLSHVSTPMESTMLLEYYDLICIIQYATYGSIIASILLHKVETHILYPSNYLMTLSLNIILIVHQLYHNGNGVNLYLVIISILIINVLLYMPQFDHPILKMGILVHFNWHFINCICVLEQYRWDQCTCQGIPTLVAFIWQHLLIQPHRIKDGIYIEGFGFICILMASLLHNQNIQFAITYHTVVSKVLSIYFMRKYAGIWFPSLRREINDADFIPPEDGQTPFVYFIVNKMYYGVLLMMHWILYLSQDEDISKWNALRCDNCKVVFEKLKTCKQCKNVRYCSRECQKISWKYIHRYECSKQ